MQETLTQTPQEDLQLPEDLMPIEESEEQTRAFQETVASLEETVAHQLDKVELNYSAAEKVVGSDGSRGELPVTKKRAFLYDPKADGLAVVTGTSDAEGGNTYVIKDYSMGSKPIDGQNRKFVIKSNNEGVTGQGDIDTVDELSAWNSSLLRSQPVSSETAQRAWAARTSGNKAKIAETNVKLKEEAAAALIKEMNGDGSEEVIDPDLVMAPVHAARMRERIARIGRSEMAKKAVVFVGGIAVAAGVVGGMSKLFEVDEYSPLSSDGMTTSSSYTGDARPDFDIDGLPTNYDDVQPMKTEHVVLGPDEDPNPDITVQRIYIPPVELPDPDQTGNTVPPLPGPPTP